MLELELTFFDSITNIPEKYQKSIDKYIRWEIQPVFDISNLNIFETSNRTLEHAVLTSVWFDFLYVFSHGRIIFGGYILQYY